MKHKPTGIALSRTSSVLCVPCLMFLLNGTSFAQRMRLEQNDPNIGYVYPAGAQRGSVTTVVVGGQYLEGADGVHISGEGVRASVTGFDRPLHMREVVRMRNRLQEAREEMGLEGGGRLRERGTLEVLGKTGITREQMRKMREHAMMRRDPKIQENAQVAEEATVEIRVDPDAESGRRELRLLRNGRISGPVAFHIGDYPERTEADKAEVEQTMPVVLNGQILPGETDQWVFEASKGDQLVVACAARELIPHLADAVPGWFQAVVALHDSEGTEVAYADDYRFNPDPVLYYEIPANGNYTLRVRDSLYRGRQDFVYRITLGEIPFVTSIFPLGGSSGKETVVKLEGKNLPEGEIRAGDGSRIERLGGTLLAYPVPFAHGHLPELVEAEPNNSARQSMPIRRDCVVNGRVETSGDRDVFAVRLDEGDELLAEVTARRLNSPLDSVLMVTDEAGQQLAFNNDFEDRSLGRVTHHADARILFTAPQSGTYHVHLGDIQNGGGADHAYRLQLGKPQPDYALRTAPSYLNGAPGASVPLTVYALRRDGFDGEIELELKNELKGLRLHGGRIPSGQDKIELTVSLPEEPLPQLVSLELEGRADIRGKAIRHLAVPAEDMMQAFIYHHLVPTEELFLANTKVRRPQWQARCADNRPRQLEPGKTARVSFHAPTWFEHFQFTYEVEPRNVPPGVTVEEVTAKRGIIEVTLNVDDSVEKGLEGNLLFDQFIERKRESEGERRGPDTVRIPIGALPAVPFRISS